MMLVRRENINSSAFSVEHVENLMVLKGSISVSLIMCTCAFRNTLLSLKDFLRRSRMQDNRLNFSYVHVM